jgi:hypothetical protein
LKPQAYLFSTLREACSARDFRAEQTGREHFTVGEPNVEGTLQYRVLDQRQFEAWLIG